MFVPLSDSPNPRGVPVMTYAIILANVAVYVLISLPLSQTPVDPNDPELHTYVQTLSRHFEQRAQLRQLLQNISQYDLFVFENGFRPAAPKVSALFLSLFLHGGFMHLFGNMLFLWFYGDNVEHRLGRLRYLFWYILTGVAATLFHTAVFRDSQLPLVGASGAISGVLGFYFLWFPHNQVRVLVLMIPFFMRVVPFSARLVLGFYLILDNLLPFLVTRGTGGTGVAFGAHIGGFVTGLTVAFWMDRRQLNAPAPDYPEAVPQSTGTSPAGAIRDALASGRRADAARHYLSLDARATRGLLRPEELLSIAHWLFNQGHPRSAMAVYLRLLRDYPSGPAAAEAHLGVGLVQLQQLGETASAYQHLLDALDLDPSPEVALQARAALQSIAARQKFRVGKSLSNGEP